MIPFRQWLAFAVAGLGLDPETFWTLTIGEWRWLTEQAKGEALSRDGLDALIALYPDAAP
ncbi:MAG TPA: phage tail assembly chaperone [Parvularcula sp.]|nr:phage tail assembly chaperone [Parvularcula sp.]HBS35084.1 phage tail assembly chaperone [Parvularcula sp.]